MVLILLLSLGLSGSGTPDPRSATVAVRDAIQCRDISDPVKRLACYDVRIGALDKIAREGTIVTLDRAEVERTRRTLFGLSLPSLPLLDGNDADSGAEPKKAGPLRELTTTIVQVSAADYGLWRLRLAEGGIWQTTEIERRIQPAPGATVVIKRGSFGNYIASIGGQRGIRLRRIG